MEFPRTGKRGRPKKPKRVPAKYLKYAQVVKERKGGNDSQKMEERFTK